MSWLNQIRGKQLPCKLCPGGNQFLEQLGLKFVAIPAGSFIMGSDNGDQNEKPAHRVSVPAFKMMANVVTFAQWDACVAAGGCTHTPDDNGRGNSPVMDVNYIDVTEQFIPWLNKARGSHFRLPSEAEWECAARAGSTSSYYWGNQITCSKTTYGSYSNECGKQSKTDPVETYKPNAFGLYDMHGNADEWVQDCRGSYRDSPADGSAAWPWDGCDVGVVRGGNFKSGPKGLRSASLVAVWMADRSSYNVGFRLAQSASKSEQGPRIRLVCTGMSMS